MAFTITSFISCKINKVDQATVKSDDITHGDLKDIKDVYDVGPVLDCFSGMVLAYWTLAKQLDHDAHSGLAIEWYQRAQETATKFNLDKYFSLEPLVEQNSLPRSHPPIHRAFSESVIGPNGTTNMENGKIERSNSNEELNEQYIDHFSRAKERPQSARPRLVQYNTSSTHSNGVTSSSNSTPEVPKLEVKTDLKSDEMRKLSNTSKAHVTVASQSTGSPASEVRVRPKSAVSKLGGGYSMPTQSNPTPSSTEVDLIVDDQPNTSKNDMVSKPQTLKGEENDENKEMLREKLIQMQIAALRKDQSSILVREVKPIEDSHKPQKKSKNLKSSPKRAQRSVSVLSKQSTLRSAEKLHILKQQQQVVSLNEKDAAIFTDTIEPSQKSSADQSNVNTTTTSAQYLHSESSNLADLMLSEKSESSKALQKNISVQQFSVAAPQSFKFIKQISNISFSSIQR